MSVTAKKKSVHYVNNKLFSSAVVDYVTEVNEKKESDAIWIQNHKIPDYIGECFMKIAEGLSHKYNFVNYTYRDEMVMDAVENCVKAITNYNVDKTTRTGLPNAFGYFTQISYFAFLRRIAKEKKQQDIKELYAEHAGISAFADFGDDVNHAGDGMVERIRSKNDNFFKGSDDVSDQSVANKRQFGKPRKKIDIPENGEFEELQLSKEELSILESFLS